MARFTHTVPRTRGPGPGLVRTVLLALFIALLGPSVLGGAHHPAPVGALLAAEEKSSAHSEPHADRADQAVSTTAVRGQREAPGDRHAPPVSDPAASSGTTTGPLQPARSPVPAVGPPASEQPAHRQVVRAPPFPSGF
ncbi:hypothetical protein [Streptomyces sp. BK239]|uniref:hypothetical protein n=1 Tax=Streptomyces sp. BK239 TaxID=2512155 RepID=UPI00102C28EC|nr:hypothetical protein [Streptomyces sp. BK239]RZU18202.1 hypothetical protein EV567_3133 [Streptomyces sp. BK239]